LPLQKSDCPGFIALVFYSALLALVVSTYKAVEAQMNDATNGVSLAHDPVSGQFLLRHKGRTAKKRRIAERLARLRLDYDPSSSQEMLLAVAAGHLDDAERCQTAIARTRATNAARRLLKDIPRKPKPSAAANPAALMTARQLLDQIG
jgi:hypothetical protein